MAVVRESSFRNLEPTQAAELCLVLDLEAGWQNLLETASPAPRGTAALQDLRGKQKAYEVFRDKLVAYNARYSPGHVSQAHLPSLSRLGAWCCAMRNLCLSVEQTPQSYCPVHLLEKAYRCADRIAARTNQGVFSRSTPADTIGAVIQELDALIRWCDSLTGVAAAS
jgi:hypothetical protein